MSETTHPVRALLCTIPLDIGIPRESFGLPVMPKIAIVSLIKWMEKHGYGPENYDFFDIDMLDSSDDEIRAAIVEAAPTVIGFSATVSTTYSQVKRIAAIAREVAPRAWLILGGSLSASARVILHKTTIDICIQGDGENPWVEFLNYTKQFGREWNYEALAQIKGLTYLIPDGEMAFSGYPAKIPGSENPFPDFDLLRLGLRTRPEAFQNYFKKGSGSAWFSHDPRTYEATRRPRMSGLWTTKGCVARCTFCQRSTKGYQTNDIATLDHYLGMLAERYYVGFIQIIDENFGSDKRHAYEVARTMKKHDMLWIVGGVRCVSVKEEDVIFYKEHGCTGLKFGIESGSQKILDVMEKNFTVEQVLTAVQHCYKHGVFSPLSVMTGMPGDNDQTAIETGTMLGKLARMYGTPPETMGMGAFYALPLPGTPLYEYAQQTGVVGTSVDEEEKYLIAISDRTADKGNYVNINGEPIRRLLFWDYMIRYEATRTYFASPLGQETVATRTAEFRSGELVTEIHGIDRMRLELEQRYPSMGSSLMRSFHRLSMSLRDNPRALLKEFLLYGRLGVFVNNRLVSSPRLARLPRPLVYGPLRTLGYAEFLMTKLVRKVCRALGIYVEPRSLFNDYKFPPPIPAEQLSSSRTIENSLRTIVKRHREQAPPPETPSDRIQLILVQGR